MLRFSGYLEVFARSIRSMPISSVGWSFWPLEPLLAFQEGPAAFRSIAEFLFESLQGPLRPDRKSTRLNSSHLVISYAVFCLKKKTTYLLDSSINCPEAGCSLLRVAAVGFST